MRGTRQRATAWAVGVLLVGVVGAVALSGGCRDESDPNYWLGKLEDSVWRDEALRRLDSMFSDVMRENNNDRSTQPVAEFIDNVGGQLIKAYDAPYLAGGGGSEDVTSRNKIITLLSQMETPAALPVYLSALEDVSGTKVDRGNTSAEAIARFCRDQNSKFPPPPGKRDSRWTERCGAADGAAPALISVIEQVSSARQDRGSNAENTPEEDALMRSTVSALGNILLGNPESSNLEAGLNKLVEVLETPDTAQDLQINMLALLMLGRIGDVRAIPVLVRAIFMQGQRRPVALQEIARVSIMQISDLNAVAEAVVRAGRMDDPGLGAMQRGDPNFDVRLIKEQMAITLGMIGIASEPVVTYITEELNHDEDDDFDRTPSRGQVSFTPALSKAYRRMWAAGALAKLRHEPALDTIMGRLEIKNRQLADRNVDMSEVPGYIDAVGDYLMPDRTNGLLQTWAVEGDEALRDRAARRLSLQGSSKSAPVLRARAEKMRECDPELRGCVKRNYLEGYIPVLEASEGCTTIDCWRTKLGDDSWRIRERAAFSLAAMTYGNDEQMAQAQEALLGVLGDRSADVVHSMVFALDRVSPRGCDEAGLARLDEVIESLRGRGSMNAARRSVEGLRARMAYRGRQGG